MNKNGWTVVAGVAVVATSLGVSLAAYAGAWWQASMTLVGSACLAVAVFVLADSKRPHVEVYS